MGIVAFASTKHPLAGLTFWHGTDAKNLPSILKEGIRPTTSHKGEKHACLTTDPACAFHYGRLEIACSRKYTGHADIVLIAIPGECLDPALLCPEYGTVDCGAFGSDMPGRDHNTLNTLASAQDWKGFLDATDCIGVRGHVPVDQARLDARFYGVARANNTINGAIDDSITGALGNADHQTRLTQAPRWITAPAAAQKPVHTPEWSHDPHAEVAAMAPIVLTFARPSPTAIPTVLAA